MIFFFLDTYGLFGAEIELWCECCYLEELFFKAHNLFGVCPTGIFSFGETNDGLCVLIFCFDFDTHFILFSELVCAVNASSVFTYIVSHVCLLVSYLSVLRKCIICKRITISCFMVYQDFFSY